MPSCLRSARTSNPLLPTSSPMRLSEMPTCFKAQQPLRREILFDAQSLLDINDMPDALQKPGVNAGNVARFHRP